MLEHIAQVVLMKSEFLILFKALQTLFKPLRDPRWEEGFRLLQQTASIYQRHLYMGQKGLYDPCRITARLMMQQIATLTIPKLPNLQGKA